MQGRETWLVGVFLKTSASSLSEKMVEGAAPVPNMGSLMRDIITWALGQFLQSLIAQVKRILMVSITAIMSCVFLSAIWVAVQKMEHSPSSTGHELAGTNNYQWAPYGIVRILKDVLQYAAIMLSFYEPLTLGNLLRHRDQLRGMNYMLQTCFNEAIDGFNQEPLLVQQNSKMVIHCDGQTVQFLSGSGDCEIAVYLLHNTVQYDVRERTAEMYLARLSARPKPLSVPNLLSVKSRLETWGVLSARLRDCLEFAVQEYAEEPLCVQDNTKMVIDCSRQVLTFASGSQANEINVYDVRDGTIHFRIRVASLWASTVRFFRGNRDHTQTRGVKALQLE